MPSFTPVFTGSLSGPDEESLGRGRRPVIFDILAPDQRTSLLNLRDQGRGDMRLVLFVNPRTMRMNYAKQTDRVQTRGGWVEFHWGDAASDATFDGATGGFMRLYTGFTSTANVQGRRETMAYEKYLDLLALFHNNGAIYDALGNLVLQGYIQMLFDGGTYTGWFDGQFTMSEDAARPYMFELSARFLIDQETLDFRSSRLFRSDALSNLSQGLDPAPKADASTSILDPHLTVGNLDAGDVFR